MKGCSNEKLVIGNVYCCEDDSYRDVYMEFPKDEAPQVYFTFPIRVLDAYMDATRCVWVHKGAIDKLMEVLKALKVRYEKLEEGSSFD